MSCLTLILVFLILTMGSRILRRPLRMYETLFILAIAQIFYFREFGYVGNILVGDYWRFQIWSVFLLAFLAVVFRFIYWITHRPNKPR